MRFGEYLKSRRRRKNITQEELAQALGVSSVYVHQLETGKVDAPGVSRCRQIAEILRIELGDLWQIAKKERFRRFMEREGVSESNLEVLSEAEKALVRLYRSLDEDTKKDFSGMVYMLLRRSQDSEVQEIVEEFIKCA